MGWWLRQTPFDQSISEPKRRTPALNEAMLLKPLPGILGIFGEPARGTAEAKAVALGIHLPAHALSIHAFEIISEQNLEVADGIFFVVTTAGIGVEVAASL